MVHNFYRVETLVRRKRDVHNKVNVNAQYLDSTNPLKMSLSVAQTLK